MMPYGPYLLSSEKSTQLRLEKHFTQTILNQNNFCSF